MMRQVFKKYKRLLRFSMTLLTVVSIIIMINHNLFFINQIEPVFAFNEGYYFMGAVVVFLIMLSLSIEQIENDIGQDLLFFIAVVAEVDLLGYIFSVIYEYSRLWDYVLMDIALFVYPLICILFWFYQKIDIFGNNYHKSLVDYGIIFCGVIDIVFIIIGTICGKMFYFDDSDCYIQGPLNRWTYIFPFFVLTLCIAVGIKYQKNTRKLIACIIFSLLPIVFGVFSLIKGSTLFSHTAIVVGIIVIYGGVQTVKRNEMVEQEKLIQKIKIEMALSQIKPHFIQNCLANINGLMYTDEKQAEKMIDNLSGYLRRTISSLNQSGVITIREEMELVDFFIAIEQARFPNEIFAIKRIETPDFRIPAFIIETLVENAVRHGIREKGCPGTVEIEAVENGEFVIISIIDDGVGFEVDELFTSDSIGIGIKNVKTRIEMMTNGSFDIKSIIGKGTWVTICIPLKGENYEGINC